MEATPKRSTLFISPGAFNIPTISPWCLAAECALRFARIEFERQASVTANLSELFPLTPKSLPALALPDSSHQFNGVSEILQLLERNNKRFDESLSDVQRGTSTSVIALVEHHMMPSLVCFILGDDTAFGTLVAAKLSNQPSRRWWHPSFASQRAAVMVWLLERHAINGMERAAEEYKRAAIALECIVRGNAVDDDPKFFLGTSCPSAADCFVFSAVSMLCHAQLPNNVDPFTIQLQKEVRNECPMLLRYVEFVRSQFFDCFAGFYSLRPIPKDSLSSNEALYRPGRSRTVLLTALFATVYFLFVNADVIVASLHSEMPAEDENAPLSAPDAKPSPQQSVQDQRQDSQQSVTPPAEQ